MPAVYEHSHIVQPDEIDELGHVNNLIYLKWMMRAAEAHSAAQGWSTDEYRRLGSGWVVRSHTIKYLRPAFVGDEVLIRTWVANFKRSRSLRRFGVFRRTENAKLTVAASDYAFIDFRSMSPGPIPREVIDAFELVPD